MLTLVLPRVSNFSISPKGVDASLFELKEEIANNKKQLEDQGEMIEKQRQALDDLVKYSVSASIFRHLCGITLLKEYRYCHSESFCREMYFLRDNGYIMPTVGDFLEFSEKTDGQDLIQFADATPIGRHLVKLRFAEMPPDWSVSLRRTISDL